MEDGRIIELFFERSEQAIEALSNKYGKAMKAISYNILQNNEDADECVNDAYLGVWNAIPPSRPDPLFAFVCRITRNISLTRYKYNNAEKRNGNSVVSLYEISDCVPSGKTVADEVEEEELKEALNSWLGTLNRDNLYIFMRRYWYMDHVSKISKQTGLSSAAIYLRIDRMKKNLRKYLTERGLFE